MTTATTTKTTKTTRSKAKGRKQKAPQAEPHEAPQEGADEGHGLEGEPLPGWAHIPGEDDDDVYVDAYQDEQTDLAGEDQGDEPAQEAKEGDKEKHVPLKEQERRDRELDIRSWLDSLPTGSDFKVDVIRRRPKQWRGVNCAGVVASYDYEIGEDELKYEHGGGTYQLQVRAPNKEGKMRYIASRNVTIAGAPRIDTLQDDGSESSEKKASGGVEERLIDMTERQLRRSESSGGALSEQLQAAMKPLEQQNQLLHQQLLELQKKNEDKDQRIYELLAAKPDTSDKDKLLENTMHARDTDLRNAREAHQEEVRRLHEHYQRQLDKMQEQHREEVKELRREKEREVASSTSNKDAIVEMTKLSYQGQIDSLKREIESKEKEVERLLEKNKELEAKKDKGPIESLEEFGKLKGTMSDLGLISEGEDKGSGLGNIMSHAEPVIARLLSGAAPGADAGGQQALPAAGQAAQPAQSSAGPSALVSEDGRQAQDVSHVPADRLPPEGVVVADGAGNQWRREGSVMVPVSAKQRRAKQARARAREGRERSSSTRRPSQDEIQRAVQYVETVYANGKDPKEVANTARSLISGEVLDYLREHGADELLKSPAVESSSSLKTQAGRKYIREIAQALAEG